MSLDLVRMRFAAVAAKIETTPGLDAIGGTPVNADWLAADCDIDFDPITVENTRWVQTSYTGKKRRRFAGIGYRYDAERDAFIPPQPFPSWRLDDTAAWVAPTPMPDDGGQYIWDEGAQYWKPLS